MKFIKNFCVFSLFFPVFLICSVFSFAAKEEGLEYLLFLEIPTVVTASNYEEPIDLAPNVMYVITEEEIEKFGYTSINDLLKRVPGFFSLYSTNINNNLISVRGVVTGENQKVAFMINGHRINNVNETSNLEWPITLDNIEKVEIIIGPGSILNGSETLLGTINLITKKMDGVELSYGANFQDRGAKLNNQSDASRYNYNSSFIAGKKIDEYKNFVLSSSFARSEGWLSQLDGTAASVSGAYDVLEPSWFHYGELEWNSWRVQGSSLSQAFSDGGAQSVNRRNYVDSVIVAKKNEHSDILSSEVKLSFDDKRMVRGSGWMDTSQHLFKFNHGFKYDLDNHLFQAGFELSYARHFRDPKASLPPAYTGSVWTADRRLMDYKGMQTRGVYFSNKYQISDQTALIGAIRLDNNSIVKSHTIYMTPRLAMVHQVADDWVFKLMFNSSLKYPEPVHSELAVLFNRSKDFPRGPLNGLAEKPERLSALEMQSIHYVNKTRISLNIYYQSIRDFIAWSADNRNINGLVSGWTNIGNFGGIGAEIDVRSSITDKLSIWANAAYENTSFSAAPNVDLTVGNTNIPYVTPDGRMNQFPQLMANIGGAYLFTDSLSLTTTVSYLTNMPTYHRWNSKGGQGFWEDIRNEFYVDTNVQWKNFLGRESMDFSFGVKNLFNNRNVLPRQREVGDYTTQGRFWEFKITSSF